MRNRNVITLILILVVAGLAIWIDFAPDNTWLGRDVSTRLGLDLQGGTQVLLKAVSQTDQAVTRDEIQTAARVIEQRVNGLGVSEAVVQTSGNDRIVVEMPGVKDPEQAIQTIRSTGQLEFVDPQAQYLTTGAIVRTSNNPNPAALLATATPTSTATLSETGALTSTATLTPTTEAQGPIFSSITKGRDLSTSDVMLNFGSNQNITSGQYAVNFAYRGESATALERWTSQNIGKPMCIVIDNTVQSCATVQATLVGGQGQITTSTKQESEAIYQQLKYGALPVSLSIESSRTVGATLGADSVSASLFAGIVGLAVVALFMILYYRLPGVLATVALLIYTAISFAIYRVVPITLTLAGIAGFVLSIGVAVDANVLIFARLKEELRKGMSLRKSVDLSFKEAWPAIRDSSAATIITSVILFMFGNSFGVSIIKGFAVTLGLGILISLFTAVTATRTFLHMIVPLPFAQNPWMYELDEAPGLEHGRRDDRGVATEA
ncbi:protein translocase subunit SecD [Chloroflexia bacterium SDU3-3]|nr:protein translocase subunit SecD [Chloroflexia bacterium SDU3-3]